MLKPRYRTFTESVSDFNRMLDGMNDFQPLERISAQGQREAQMQRKSLEEAAPAIYQADVHVRQLLDNAWYYMPGDLRRESLDLYDEEQKYADFEDKVASGNWQLSEEGAREMGNKAVEMAGRYSALADRYDKLAERSVGSEGQNYSKMSEAARNKAKDWEAKTEQYVRRPAPTHRMEAKASAMDQFRMLAGLDGRELAPRDPGMSGTTRFNAAYIGEETEYQESFAQTKKRIAHKTAKKEKQYAGVK